MDAQHFDKQQATSGRAAGVTPAMRMLAGSILAAATLLGCTGDTGTADALEGVWVSPNGVWMTFEDGTWEAQYYSVRSPEYGEEPFDAGTYDVDGTTLTMTQDLTDDIEPNPLTCPEGSVGVYEVDVSDDGTTLQFDLVEDDCDARASDMQAGDFTEVEQ